MNQQAARHDSMCSLNREPVSPSPYQSNNTTGMKNLGCTADGTSDEKIGREIPMDVVVPSPTEVESGTTADQSFEPNHLDLGAPIHSAGPELTPYEQAVEDLRRKRQRLYKPTREGLIPGKEGTSGVLNSAVSPPDKSDTADGICVLCGPNWLAVFKKRRRK